MGGTGLYYPSGDGSSFCVKDTSAMPCPPGETCHRVDGWVRAVYDTIAECCQSGIRCCRTQCRLNIARLVALVQALRNGSKTRVMPGAPSTAATLPTPPTPLARAPALRPRFTMTLHRNAALSSLTT